MSSKQITLKPNSDIGRLTAEVDKFYLDKCFIEHPALEELEDFKSSKMIALGRTGSGKTAIMYKISMKTHNKKIIMDLENMAINYIANSTEINFLKSIGVDLDLFFQYLWKHVICLELIRVMFKVESEEKSKNVIKNLLEFFRTDRKKQGAINYIKNFETKFWLPMEDNIIEVTKKLEQEIKGEFSGEISNFTGKANYRRKLSEERREFLVQKAKKIVSAEQLTKLNKLVEVIKEYPTDKYFSCYVFIDKIDEKWVDQSIRFNLIKALIEGLKKFVSLNHVKVIVAMRTDVLERIVNDRNELGLQTEKYNDYMYEISWDKNKLREIVESRLNLLFKHKYTTENVGISDIFKTTIDKKDPFDYMLSRTLYRPRDIILFVNLCLEEAGKEEKSEVTKSMLMTAEYKYSTKKLESLIQEWQFTFPKLDIMLNSLRNCVQYIKASYLLENSFFDELVQNMSASCMNEFDPFQNEIVNYYDNLDNENKLRQKVICNYIDTLYRIGVIGVKTEFDEYYKYTHKDKVIFNTSPNELHSLKICVHPMFHRELNIK